jgi:hypothetical protein
VEPEESYVLNSWNKSTSSLSPKSMKQRFDLLLGASKALFFPPLEENDNDNLDNNKRKRINNKIPKTTESSIHVCNLSSSFSELLFGEKISMISSKKKGKWGNPTRMDDIGNSSSFQVHLFHGWCFLTLV